LQAQGMSPVIIGIKGSTLSHGFENPFALLVDLLLFPPFSLLYWPNPSPASTTLFKENDALVVDFQLCIDTTFDHDFDDEIETASQTNEKMKLKRDMRFFRVFKRL
jgi:hypothetical protein